jgi:hypothetical protein
VNNSGPMGRNQLADNRTLLSSYTRIMIFQI